MGITKLSRKMEPKLTSLQFKQQKIRLENLVTEITNFKNEQKFIIDDETYFTLDGAKNQPKYFYSINGNNVSKINSKIPKDKYPEQVMLWLAISEKGISEPVFFKENKRLTGDSYSKKCIPKLERFIERKHKRCKIIF